MAKYTTQLRTICENFAGYDEHQDAFQMEQVIDESWDKIFDSYVYEKFEYTQWDTSSSEPLWSIQFGDIVCKHILRNFYTREIGAESVGLFLHWLNERLLNNFDYINDLYKGQIQLANYDGSRLQTTDYREYYYDNFNIGKNGELQGSDTSAKTNNYGDTSDYDNTNANSNNKMYSDTPQGDFELIDGVNPTPSTHLQYATDGEFESGGGTDTEDVSSNGTRVDSKSKTYTGTHDYYKTKETDNAQKWGSKYSFDGKLIQEVKKEIGMAYIQTEAELNRIFGDLFLNLY